MKIVILDGFAANPGDISWEGLKALGECTIYDRTAPEEVLERSAGAEVILTNKVIINADHMAALPELKYIGVLATGYNVVDTPTKPIFLSLSSIKGVSQKQKSLLFVQRPLWTSSEWHCTCWEIFRICANTI